MVKKESNSFDIDLDLQDADKSVKPNSTITLRQKRLLDQMAEMRYASRSEALRAAIEVLRERLEGNGAQPINELRLEIQSIESEIKEIAEEVKTIHSALIAAGADQRQRNNIRTENRAQTQYIAESTDSPVKLAKTVQDLVLRMDQPTIWDLTTHSGLTPKEALEGILDLQDRGLITASKTQQQIEFQLSDMEG